jgi:hypothetical protein
MPDHKFSLQRVHMYNQLLRYEDGDGVIEVIVEDSPDFEEYGLLVWERDFSDNQERRGLILQRFVEWAQQQNLKHTIIYDRKRC